jgi:hypothetical protein
VDWTCSQHISPTACLRNAQAAQAPPGEETEEVLEAGEDKVQLKVPADYEMHEDCDHVLQAR